MLRLGKCPHHIAPSVAMFINFKWNTQTTNKKQLLASNYSTFQLLVVCKNIATQIGPSTQLIDALSFVQMWNTTIEAREQNWKRY